MKTKNSASKSSNIWNGFEEVKEEVHIYGEMQHLKRKRFAPGGGTSKLEAGA